MKEDRESGRLCMCVCRCDNAFAARIFEAPFYCTDLWPVVIMVQTHAAWLNRGNGSSVTLLFKTELHTLRRSRFAVALVYLFCRVTQSATLILKSSKLNCIFGWDFQILWYCDL